MAALKTEVNIEEKHENQAETQRIADVEDETATNDEAKKKKKKKKKKTGMLCD